MGRMEALTALALGRGHYEDEVIYNDNGQVDAPADQQYNESGRPKNPETKRREREHVRAANEVMQVTGVVEDSIAAKLKATEDASIRNHETFTGLRLMELGRAVLVGGVWGVLGLRRRILIYRPYSHIGIFAILKQEAAVHSVTHMLFAGFPTVLAYHVADWAAFFCETILDTFIDEDEKDLTPNQKRLKSAIQGSFDVFFCYLNLHLRRFALLQQLNLISSSRLLPSIASLIPFTAACPIIAPPAPGLNITSIISWGKALVETAAPFLVIMAHGKLKFAVSKLMYRPVYKIMPRPIGPSMFAGLAITAPTMEYDTPDRPPTLDADARNEEELTIRFLEQGQPPAPNAEEPPQQLEPTQDSSDDEDDEMAHATLISFDVEATESVENSLGTWSAELRSANEPKPSGAKYRITGLTILPTIMATEGLREIVSGIIMMPLEAIMVRLIGRAFRVSSGLGTADLYPIRPRLWGFTNLVVSLTMQLAITGVVWAGFTASTQFWAARKRQQQAEKIEAEVSSST